jgi:hypothetical protein
MQCGAGARPEWAGKKLVAVKRMKKRWEGGWDECRKLRELEVSKLLYCFLFIYLLLGSESDRSAPECHPSLRFFPITNIKRTLFCIRIDGG